MPAGDRATYLQRPDLGRQLDVASQRALDTLGLPYGTDRFDVAFALVDGLSSRAIHRHAVPLLGAVLDHLHADALPWSVAPIAIVEQGRVAIGNDIGTALCAPGRTDADRTCLSNIRPEGMPYADAATRLVALLAESRRRQLSGVPLKDERDVLPGRSAIADVLLAP